MLDLFLGETFRYPTEVYCLDCESFERLFGGLVTTGAGWVSVCMWWIVIHLRVSYLVHIITGLSPTVWEASLHCVCLCPDFQLFKVDLFSPGLYGFSFPSCKR